MFQTSIVIISHCTENRNSEHFDKNWKIFLYLLGARECRYDESYMQDVLCLLKELIGAVVPLE